MTPSFIWAGIIGLALNLVLTPVLAWLARRSGILDHPGALKTHQRPVPYLGGVGTFLCILTAILVVGAGTGPDRIWIQTVLVGTGGILILGLADDIRTIPIPIKLLWQMVIAGALIFNGVKIHLFEVEWMNNLLSLVWVVGMTNALNLVDIMDGLAGTIVITASITLGLLSWEHGLMASALLASATTGAAIAFLVYNWPAAKIFLGDAGSLQMGFILSALAMSARYTSRHSIGYMAPLIILAIPLTETLFLIWQRRIYNRPITWGSEDHMALRLERHGWSRRRILHSTIGLSCTLCVLASLIVHVPAAPAVAITAVLAIGLAWLLRWMHRHP